MGVPCSGGFLGRPRLSSLGPAMGAAPRNSPKTRKACHVCYFGKCLLLDSHGGGGASGGMWWRWGGGVAAGCNKMEYGAGGQCWRILADSGRSSVAFGQRLAEPGPSLPPISVEAAKKHWFTCVARLRPPSTALGTSAATFGPDSAEGEQFQEALARLWPASRDFARASFGNDHGPTLRAHLRPSGGAAPLSSAQLHQTAPVVPPWSSLLTRAHELPGRRNLFLGGYFLRRVLLP